MKDIDRLKLKVRKLLAQAEDREGTPEGEVFYARAFDMMAAYGFDARDLTRPDAGDEVTRLEIDLTGAYTDMQAVLLLAIASALHCTGLHTTARNSTRVPSVTLFGLRRHLDRVGMLHALLNPAMLLGARRHSSTGWYGTSTVVKRRSFMTGFAQSVGSRLSAAEDSAAAADTRYALALVDDLDIAERARDDYIRNAGLHVTSCRARRSYDGAAYGDGVYAGAQIDLGQDRVRARPAFPGGPGLRTGR